MYFASMLRAGRRMADIGALTMIYYGLSEAISLLPRWDTASHGLTGHYLGEDTQNERKCFESGYWVSCTILRLLHARRRVIAEYYIFHYRNICDDYVK